MEMFTLYEAKAALTLCAFYVMYRILLKKETLFVLRRACLLVSSASAFILPHCVLNIHKTVYVQEAADVSAIYKTGIVSADASLTSTVSLGFADVIGILILAGAVFCLLKTVLQILQVHKIIKSGKVVGEEDGCRVVVAPGLVSPFSWMQYIVIGEEDSADSNDAIIIHEKAHANRYHTIDVLLMDVMVMMQWFNPVAWVLRDELRAVHEYEADDVVLRHGLDMKSYQYMLVRKAVQASGYSIANNFNRSLISSRICMMAKRRSSPLASFKVLYLFLIASVSVAANANVVHDYIVESKQEIHSLEVIGPELIEMAAEESVNTLPVKAERLASPVIKPEPMLLEQEVEEPQQVEESKASVQPETEIDAPVRYADVEQKPTFDGGSLAKFDKWLSQTIMVPEEMESGIMLRIAVNFLVDADGSLSGFKILGSLGEPYSTEAIRAVASSQGMWAPGMTDGKPVATEITMPVSFRR